MQKKWIVALIVAVAAPIAYYLYSDNAIPVQMATAEKGDVVEYIEEHGKTTLPKIYHITMPLDGRIFDIALEEGSTVKKGQIIAEMDTADLKTALAKAQSDLQVIVSRIELNQYNDIEKTSLQDSANVISSAENTLKASQKQVESSEARRNFAKWMLDQQEKLYGDKNTPLERLNEAKTSYIEASVKYQSDQLVTHALSAIVTTIKLMPTYINQYLHRKVLEREILLQQKKGAEASVARAQRDLQRATIKSPINGVILKRYIANERFLPVGTGLFDLGNLTGLQVTVDILSQDVARVKIDDDVDIFLGINDQSIKGKVKQIKPVGITKTSSLGVEQQRVPVVISLSAESLHNNGNLGVEYRVRTKIYTAVRKNTVKIPRTAVFLGAKDQWKAFLVKNGIASKTPLKIGVKNDYEVEVLEGIKPGDQVIVAPESSLTDGVAVK